MRREKGSVFVNAHHTVRRRIASSYGAGIKEPYLTSVGGGEQLVCGSVGMTEQKKVTFIRDGAHGGTGQVLLYTVAVSVNTHYTNAAKVNYLPVAGISLGISANGHYR